MKLFPKFTGARPRAWRWPRFGVSAASLPRLCTFVLVLALAASATNWVLILTARRTPLEPLRVVATGNPAARTQAPDVAPVAVLFGARPGADAGDIKLVGVIAQGAQGKGIALLAVDGQPAQPVSAGEEIATGVILAEVRSDRVLVSRSGAMQEIRMPAKPVPEGIVKVR